MVCSGKKKKGLSRRLILRKRRIRPENVLRDYIEKHPGHLPEALLCEGNCAELGSILRGEKDAVQVLFSGIGAELLDHFYGDGLFTSHWLAAIAAAVSTAARSLPEGRGLRILEIGAGTGGLASQVLPLLERGLHSYTFSDVSAAFFSGAAQKLAAFSEVEFKIFDLEKPGAEQELEAETFDFIIGTNVLHAVKDVRAALRNLHGLLAPGGSLIFMDTATPQLWTETVFGLTSGWWRFTDRDLRPEQPLLKREQWETVLRESGFCETASLPGLIGPTGGEGQIGLLARKSVEEVPVLSRRHEAPEEKSWLVFADASGVGDALVSRLRELGVRCRVARPGRQFRVRWQRRFYAAPGNAGGLANSSFEDCGSPHRSASFIFGISMHDKWSRHGEQSGRTAPSYPGTRIRSAGGEAASRFGNAQRAACRQRSATDGRGASAEHWTDARHFERTFQSPLARDRSPSGTVPRCGIALERNISQGRGTRNRVAR